MEQKDEIIRELKARCEDLKHGYEKRTTELEQAEKLIDELKGKISFMEGQIDAYQYCLNSRFLR